jgi:phosphate-selective porin OprO/OprP
VLTGETASDRGVRPQHPFDPPTGRWGALQVVARFSQIDIDDDVFALGFAGTGAAETARQFTVGVNWYPATVFKYYLTYERTEFAGGSASRADEHVILFRVQLGI